ncbi:hypothetical protein D3C71_1383250 [compost metagenome]
MGQGGPKIGHQGRPRRQDGPLAGFGARQGDRQRADSAQVRNRRLRKPLAAQGRLIGRGDPGQAPEDRDQLRRCGAAGGMRMGPSEQRGQKVGVSKRLRVGRQARADSGNGI